MRRRVALVVGVIALGIAGFCVLRSLRTRPEAQASLHSTSAHAASAPSTQEQLVDADLTASEPPEINAGKMHVFPRSAARVETVANESPPVASNDSRPRSLQMNVL